jgi:hypothetical protein
MNAFLGLLKYSLYVRKHIYRAINFCTFETKNGRFLNFIRIFYLLTVEVDRDMVFKKGLKIETSVYKVITLQILLLKPEKCEKFLHFSFQIGATYDFYKYAFFNLVGDTGHSK